MLCKQCYKKIPAGEEIQLGSEEGGGIICKECEKNKLWSKVYVFLALLVFVTICILGTVIAGWIKRD